MVDRPAGTVTFLFTDIEGSTRRWEDDPQSMRDLLARHDAIVRAAVEEHSGLVFATGGDGFAVAFQRASDGLSAAIACQEVLQREGLPAVRMSLHTGETVERDGDYFGPTVNRAARLMAVAHGGQILVSGATEQVVSGFELRDLGEHRLRDLSRPMRVYQLVASGLVSAFPPLRSLDAVLGNLPVQVTGFVGREPVVRTVAQLVGEHRVVTLTGVGGVGKTRLALQVAGEVLDGFRDGVWLVELASVTQPQRVAAALASTMGVRQRGDAELVDTLCDGLRERDALIVLDNCEHVLDAAARLADQLARSCQGVKILVTSRERLGIPGEHCVRIATLAVPADDETVDAATLLRFDAVRLFVERAREQVPSFALDRDNANAIAAICRRIDGIPLAIELAAARLRSLTAAEIEARLDDRFRLLSGGSRTALARQQTLRALIDWSYELLKDGERLALCRLSAFVGGCTLEAAESVVADHDAIAAADVVDLVTALVDKNLLSSEPTPRGTRYRMLETIREYAADRLSELGGVEVDVAARCHRDYYLELAERAAPHLDGPDQIAWLQTLDDDDDNLRSAIAYTLNDPSGAVVGLRFVASLCGEWERSKMVDALTYASATLDRPDAAAPTAERAAALTATAPMLIDTGQNSRARELLDEALSIAQTLDDARLTVKVLYSQGYAQFRLGNLDVARHQFERSLKLAREHADDRGELFAVKGLADVLSERRDPTSRLYYQQALETARAMGDLRTIAVLCTNYGLDEAVHGSLDNAEQLQLEASTISRELNYTDLLASNIGNLGLIALLRADTATATARFSEVLDIGRRTHNRQILAYGLLGGASVAFITREHTNAAKLYGAADAITAQLDTVLEDYLRETRTAHLQALRRTLGDTAFDAAYRTGRDLPLSSAADLVNVSGTSRS